MRSPLPIPLILAALSCLAGGPGAGDTHSALSVPMKSPIAYFRELLVMTEGERFAELERRPEAQRAGLQAKIEEYAALPATERELRLRATELRFFLLPLMQLPAEERQKRLSSVPEDIRDLVEDRLVQWTLIPPSFQQQLLENQATLQLFSRMHPDSAANADELVGRLPTVRVGEMQEDFERWQALSPDEQAHLLKGFNHFFQLTEAEQERTLRRLSAEERVAMQKTLQQFEALPPDQRGACIQAVQQFVIMPPAERAQFLRNVDRWQAMSPEAREEWRTVVDQLSQMPPLPPGVEPVLVPDSPPLPPGVAAKDP
ncbi:MAG: DUF3106 domain-containing protein [Verrucomicrobia bacterium]|jgi:hypothetical protein|nr:DUF3106 domain-containing protein [Verrucomicrobiota bacterium]